MFPAGYTHKNARPKRSVSSRTISDYSPFGVLLPERSVNTGDFRYGFQAQEHDDEVKGEGNSINFNYRMHDPRTGRFFAVDHLTSQYPFNSSYAFSQNVLINAIELEGLEKMYTYVYNSINKKFDYIWTKTNKALTENVNRYVYFDVHGNVSKTVIHSMDGERTATYYGKEDNYLVQMQFKSIKNQQLERKVEFDQAFKNTDNYDPLEENGPLESAAIYAKSEVSNKGFGFGASASLEEAGIEGRMQSSSFKYVTKSISSSGSTGPEINFETGLDLILSKSAFVNDKNLESEFSLNFGNFFNISYYSNSSGGSGLKLFVGYSSKSSNKPLNAKISLEEKL